MIRILCLTICLLSLTACKVDGTVDTGTSPTSPTASQPGTVTPTLPSQPDTSTPTTPTTAQPDPVVVTTPDTTPIDTTPTIDPLHACAAFAALGTWVNMADATDILTFNDDCTMSDTYCNETFTYDMPLTADLTHAATGFETTYTGPLDTASTAFGDHRVVCEPNNHINTQLRLMAYTTLNPVGPIQKLPANQIQILSRYDGFHTYQVQ